MKMVHIIGAWIALAGVTPALAQTGVVSPPNSTASSPDRVSPGAPVGHRQPRAAEAPQPQASGAQATDDENARQDAALDRKIKGICKGC